MTNRYIVKIAKEYYNRVEESDPRVSSALGAAAVGGVAAHQLNSRVGNLLQRHVVAPMLNFEPTLPDSVLSKLRDDTLKATNSTMNLAEAGGSKAAAGMMAPVIESAGPSFVPYQSLNSNQSRMHKILGITNKLAAPLRKLTDGKMGQIYDGSLAGKPTFNKNFVHLGGAKNTDILAHELGHAVDFTRGPTALKRGVSEVARRLHGVPAAALGGLALTNEKTRDYAWLAPIALSAPTLREEAAANLNAAKLVKQYGGNASKLRGLFGRNLLSYSLPVAAASGALAGINYLRRKGEEVNPEDWIKDRE